MQRPNHVLRVSGAALHGRGAVRIPPGEAASAVVIHAGSRSLLHTEAQVLVVVTPYAQEAAVDEPGALLLGKSEPKAGH